MEYTKLQKYKQKYHKEHYLKKPKKSSSCKLCGGKIPDSKPSTTLYCSDICANKIGAKTHREKYGCKNHAFSYKKIVIELLGGQCNKCKIKKELQIDHIVPIFMGGKSEIKNLQVLCIFCHKKKTKNEIKKEKRG